MTESAFDATLLSGYRFCVGESGDRREDVFMFNVTREESI
jgi:hypothetical protein